MEQADEEGTEKLKVSNAKTAVDSLFMLAERHSTQILPYLSPINSAIPAYAFARVASSGKNTIRKC